jgi:hypothetical protein
MTAFSGSEFSWVVYKVVAIIATALASLVFLAWMAVRKWPSK